MTSALFQRSTSPYRSGFLLRHVHPDDAGDSASAAGVHAGQKPGQDTIQRVYYEEHGTPRGIPALYLHGGPGGGLARRGWTQLFDPTVWRLVGMDQRGCGQSTPLATDPAHSIAANTTGALIEDIEALRIALGIDRWIIYGVSWGTTLALAYARAYPDRVRGMVLLGVTTTSEQEIEWISSGVRALFPEDWFTLESDITQLEAEVSALERMTHPKSPSAPAESFVDQQPFIKRVARLVQYPDPSVRERAIAAWARWETAHVTIGQTERPEPPPVADVADFATLTTHYWAHHAFLDVPLLAELGGARHIETHLIHGRLDVSGPVWAAWRLSRLMPNSQITVVETERHGGPQMIDAAARALAQLSTREEPASPQSPMIVEN